MKIDGWLVRDFNHSTPSVPPADPHVLLLATALESFFICRYVHSSLWLNRWEHCRPGPRIKFGEGGFELGFSGPRVLIPRGVDTVGRRLRATYLEAPLTFQDIIQALVVPRGEERRAKLLTALLNSRLIAWFAFHGTASFGSERPEVKQAELLTLPFPSPDDMPQRERSESAGNALVALVDRMIESADEPFGLGGNEWTTLDKVDHLTCEFFCLSGRGGHSRRRHRRTNHSFHSAAVGTGIPTSGNPRTRKIASPMRRH